jgi:non-specific serine/threonine protein kinase
MPGDALFAALLQRYRAAAGMSQEELAERAGLSRRGISDLERGERRAPHLATVRRLADALGLSQEERTALLATRSAAVAASRHRRGVADGQAQMSAALPLALSTFVGRDRDLDGLCQLLRTARCVTLVGPGGVGKTRLALELSSGLAGAFADGVYLVELAPLTAPELVAQVTARALRVRVELDRQPQSALVRFLATRQVLLLLDNCEHLLEACAGLIVPLLQGCPGVRVLATSREPLAIDGETMWRLGPLDEPAAMRLFIQRARAQDSSLDARDEAVVGQLCRRLDCLPLAIELAAARVGLLAPAEILPRLEDRFALLTRLGGRGSPPRHQTLRATVDWSYELLDRSEQQLFRRLAVFAGRFDLAAANAMGGPETLDVLGHLVDKSLVVAERTPDGTRYRLLDTLRSYGWDRLRETDELDLARRRHLEHFLSLAEALYQPPESVDGPTRVLDGELDNLRSALEWCSGANAEAGVRLVAATLNVWWRRSCAEGRQWAHAFLARCPAPSLARCQALYTAGRFELLANPSSARGLLAEARQLAVPLADDATLAAIDGALGLACLRDERPAEAIEHLGRALATFEALQYVRERTSVLTFRACVMLRDADRREEARHELERLLADELSDQWIAGIAENGLGLYWQWTGQPRRALEHFRRSIELLHALEEVPLLSEVLLQISRLVAVAEPVRAARLGGAWAALIERTGIQVPPRINHWVDELRAELNTRLGREQAQWLWHEGERLAWQDVVALALDHQHGGGVAPGGLSARELQVSRLIGEGVTSRQIGAALHLSTRTVDSHLGRIYTKIGVANRLQLAAWLSRNDSDQQVT